MAFNLDDLKKKANILAAQASELAQQAAVLAQAGAARSKQLATVAKLKANNLAEEDTIRKAYIELGKTYFEKFGANPEEEFAAACTTIIEAQAAIVANNAQIEELMTKQEPDIEVEITVEEDVTEEAPAEETPVEEAPAAEEEAPVEETPVEEEAPVAEDEEEKAE